ncbi:unnamed protein product [Sphenostylis stenocarpa]|uniref:GH18 domain-containing protein n=1 Tax=Sphenostylis stenocarpa TaxID=92480 RepID=A0AA86W0X4_9FABA|nr:unnamed protein product [Sphenostylis stenocarpa]
MSSESKPIFREYIIGHKPGQELDRFPVEIIDKRIHDFHFILAFAADDYVEDPTTKKRQGKGNFSRDWNTEIFNAESVRRLKQDYPNVKVAISFGGHGSQFPFNPLNREVWIDNAKKSLSYILLEDFKGPLGSLIDGIDVYYDYIESSEDDFAYSIGKVIDHLKTLLNGFVVSLAPSHSVLSHYERLYKANTHRVRWVNYQYYYQPVPTTPEFVNLHKTLIDIFGSKNLLAGYSTDPNERSKIPLEVFIEGSIQLISSGLLPGLFISDAQSSVNSDPPLYAEEKAQKLLTPSH